MKVLPGRKFGITAEGHPGLFPSGTEIGDEIGIILGLDIPVVIRECAKANRRRAQQKYLLVGECYVHGLMDGEGLDEGEMEEIVFQ